jgi:hypothetical protein
MRECQGDDGDNRGKLVADVVADHQAGADVGRILAQVPQPRNA